MNIPMKHEDLVRKLDEVQLEPKGWVWVPVSERLPEYGSVVMVAFTNVLGTTTYTTAKFVSQKVCADPASTTHVDTWYVYVSSGHKLNTVTHWCSFELLEADAALKQAAEGEGS